MKPFAAAGAALVALAMTPTIARAAGPQVDQASIADSSAVTVGNSAFSDGASFTTAVDAIADYHQTVEAQGAVATQGKAPSASLSALLPDGADAFDAQPSIGTLDVAQSDDPFDFRLPGGLGATIHKATRGLAGLAGLTTTPEPATWAMMLVGFAGIGLALRRRLRLTAAA